MNGDKKLLYRSFNDDAQVITSCVETVLNNRNRQTIWHEEKIKSKQEYFKQRLIG